MYDGDQFVPEGIELLRVAGTAVVEPGEMFVREGGIDTRLEMDQQ